MKILKIKTFNFSPEHSDTGFKELEEELKKLYVHTINTMYVPEVMRPPMSVSGESYNVNVQARFVSPAYFMIVVYHWVDDENIKRQGKKY